MADSASQGVPPLPPPVAPVPTLPPTPAPGQPFQIMLPPELQTVMQQFPGVLTRLGALEAKPVERARATTVLVAWSAFLGGVGVMTLLIFLWHYGAVLFRL